MADYVKHVKKERESVNKIIIIVEGETDSKILQHIFYAAKFPLDRIDFIVAKGKSNIPKVLENLPNTRLEDIIVLFDSDEINIPDSNKYAKEMLSNTNVEGFCAVPTIEAWIFADDLLFERVTKKPYGNKIVERLPLPEEIPYPKYLLAQCFKGVNKDLSFIKEMNIERACARTPSLKNFLLEVSKKIGLEYKLIEESFSRNIDRDIIMNLIKEVAPKDTIIYKTLDGENYTAMEMEKEIRDGSLIGKEYASDILRLARDILKRRAQRGE